MTWTDYGKWFLALTDWREARGEIYLAKLGMAYSALNRVARPSWWGHTLDQVLGKKYQYSSTTNPGDANLVKWPMQPDASFEDCMKAVDAAISGTEPNPCPGADSYYDVSIPAPKWATDECFVRQIGNIRFYNTDHDHEAEVTGHV